MASAFYIENRSTGKVWGYENDVYYLNHKRYLWMEPLSAGKFVEHYPTRRRAEIQANYLRNFDLKSDIAVVEVTS